MNIQRKNSAHHFRMQSEREQTFRTSLNNVTRFHPSKSLYLYKNQVQSSSDIRENFTQANFIAKIVPFSKT